MRILIFILLFWANLSQGQIVINSFKFASGPAVQSFTNNWSGAAVSSIATDKPTGVAADDGLIVLFGGDDDTPTTFSGTNAPSGFTFGATAGTADTDNAIAFFHRLATGGEASTFEVVSISPTQDAWIAAIRISGVRTAGFIGTVGTAGVESFSSSIAIPEITTTNNNSLVVAFVGTDGSDVNYSSLSGSGWVLGEAVEGADSTDNTNGVWIYKEMPTAGATGSPTVNFSTTDGLVGFMFEIRSE